MNANKRDIACTPFASKETMLGLIITMTSTPEIIDYLVAEYGFSYVITAKLNQDCLEARSFKITFNDSAHIGASTNWDCVIVFPDVLIVYYFQSFFGIIRAT